MERRVEKWVRNLSRDRFERKEGEKRWREGEKGRRRVSRGGSENEGREAGRAWDNEPFRRQRLG